MKKLAFGVVVAVLLFGCVSQSIQKPSQPANMVGQVEDKFKPGINDSRITFIKNCSYRGLPIEGTIDVENRPFQYSDFTINMRVGNTNFGGTVKGSSKNSNYVFDLMYGNVPITGTIKRGTMLESYQFNLVMGNDVLQGKWAEADAAILHGYVYWEAIRLKTKNKTITGSIGRVFGLDDEINIQFGDRSVTGVFSNFPSDTHEFQFYADLTDEDLLPWLLMFVKYITLYPSKHPDEVIIRY
jgi:hypothetical protein